MSVDGIVPTAFQTLLKYDNHNIIMNSDCTCIQQSIASTKMQKQYKSIFVLVIIILININCTTNHNYNINIFNILNNDKPVGSQYNNRYVGIESGNLNYDELINIIEDIIEHAQDQPAALFTDALDR